MRLQLIKNDQRVVLDTEIDREKLENARNYFGDAATLMIIGLGCRLSNETAARYFQRVKAGENPTGKTHTFSVEEWETVVYYSLLHKNGERYDSQKFLRPEF